MALTQPSAAAAVADFIAVEAHIPLQAHRFVNQDFLHNLNATPQRMPPMQFLAPSLVGSR